MKSIIFLLLIFGIIFVSVGYYKSNQQCPPPIVQFRYVPQTFEQEQLSQEPILSSFNSMFEDNSAWMKNQGYSESKFTK